MHDDETAEEFACHGMRAPETASSNKSTGKV